MDPKILIIITNKETRRTMKQEKLIKQLQKEINSISEDSTIVCVNSKVVDKHSSGLICHLYIGSVDWYYEQDHFYDLDDSFNMEVTK